MTGLVRHLLPLAGAAGIEFHGHNDLGMATANALAAVTGKQYLNLPVRAA